MGGAQPRESFEAPPETSRFQIVRRLGAGGMGEVFEADDLLRGTRVALKVLRRLGPEALLRFKTEFRALADLQHPNLVRLDELIADGTQWFFTMERVEGVDFLAHVAAPGAAPELALSHTLEEDAEGAERGVAPLMRAREARSPPAASGRRFDEARLRGALAQLVQGLAALHAAGKVHRDIKPANVLVTPEGRVVLLDFGVIADVRRAPDHHVVGTPLYMAPEQADVRAVGPAADWYAVGLVLYEALTGQLPFGASPRESLELKKRLEPAPPSSLGIAVPEDLDRLCADLLRIDPGARPDDAEVLRRLSIPAAELGPRGRFVGRRRELDELDARFAAGRGGQAQVLLIHGESGTGKTALVTRFIERLDPAVVVLAGRCCERESVPYNAIDDVVDDLSWYLKGLPPAEAAALLPGHGAALAQLFPVLQRVPPIAEAMQARGEPAPEPRELRLRAFAALRELIASIARRHPLVLAIDDLQWADADSSALLVDLLSPPAPPGLLLLATVRSSSSGAGAEVPPLPEARHLHLSGFPPEEARELAEALLAREAARPDERRQIAAAIAGESGGHPLFIDELVRRKRALGMRPEPPRLEEALAARVRELPAEERAVLELVAVAGAPLAREIAAAATGLGFDDLVRRVASLRAVNLIRSAASTTGPAVEPYHDRVRRAVIAGLAPASLRELHLRLAVTLEQRGADAEALAVHFHEAGEARRAASWAAIAAARAAAALAFDRAASLFRMAAAHEPPGTPEGQRLRVGLAEALANAGHGAEAARAFEEAAAVVADGALARDLHRRAAEQYLRGGHMDAGLAAMSRVLEPFGLALPPTPRRALASLALRRARLRLRGLHFRERAASDIPPAELARIDACHSAASVVMADYIRGADFQARALLGALDAGEPYRIARALALEAGNAAARGVPGRARTEHLLGLSGRLARRIDHPHALGLVEFFTGLLRMFTGEWQAAREHCERARAILRDRCLGVAWELDMIDFTLLWTLICQGELAEVARRVPRLLRDANDRGDRYAATTLRTSALPYVLLAADRPMEARREGFQAIRSWSRDGFLMQHTDFEICTDGQISLYLGDAEAAHRRISELWPAFRGSMLTLIQDLHIRVLHVRARCALAAARIALGRARSARLRVAERAARRIAREHAPWSRGWVDILSAGISAVRGDPEAAASLARAAASHCEAAGMRLHAAAARRRLGELLGGDEGRRLIADADAWMASQGIRRPDRMTAVLAPGFPGG